MIISYSTQIQNQGWNLAVNDGATSGTIGQALRMEAIIISLLELNGLNIAMEYQTHVENYGWMGLKSDGQVSGTVGEFLRLEALRIRLVGLDAKKYSVKYRLHIENYGWQLWCKDGETAGTEGVALRAEAIEIRIELISNDTVIVVPETPVAIPVIDPITGIPAGKTLCASYAVHIENFGWQADVTDGRLAGRVGQGLRMEAIRIALINTGNLNLGVAYSTHVENLGWQTEVANGQTAGTTDQGLRMEAIKMRLTGTDASKYSIWYRVHVQNEAWQEWRRDGEAAGTVEQALRAETIQILITLKTDNLIRTPGQSPLIAVNYQTHIQNLAWGAWVKNGQKSGTTGLGLRMEAIKIKLSSLDSLGVGVLYRTHIENQGWGEWVPDDTISGTVSLGLRLEAVEIKLTGVDAAKYIVKYRGHIENQGWSGWFVDGATLGTVGLALRAEAISIVLIKKADLGGVITNEIKNKAPYLQIWAVEFPKAEVLLHDIRTDYHVLDPKLTEGINKVSGFNFTIDPTHEHYNSLRKMATVIYVYEVYSNMEKKQIFEGRILTDTEDFNKMRAVTCEGELAYLLDSTQRPHIYENVTPEQYLTMKLDNHNMSVTSEKRLYMGICTMLGDGTGNALTVAYRTHIENQAWTTLVKNGDESGSVGLGLRMEALEVTLEHIGSMDLHVSYRVHLQNLGWQDWVVDGVTSGTVNQSLRLEAIEIKLTGADAAAYSVQYRVHVQDVGWQDWQADGTTAGTTGLELRAESICIIVVSKSGTIAIKDSIGRENEHVNTLECIKTALLDTLGGVLRIEQIGSIKFLNYLENYGRVSEQPIEFGLNMLDYSKTVDASGTITALIPFGAEIDGKKLNITSVNSDSDYIYDEVAVAEHGWVFGFEEFKDITDATVLMAAGKTSLAGKIHEGTSLEMTAVDLGNFNIDIKKLEVGDMVPCKSKPHGVDEFMSLSKKERNLSDPSKDKIVLGAVAQSLTDRVSGPLGGGIMGFQMAVSNTVKNMEFVSNELSFMIKLTSEKTDENATQLNETSLIMDAFSIDLLAKETRISDAETAVDAAELKITPSAITQTVRDSTEYAADLNGKVNDSELSGNNLVSIINQTATTIDINAEKLNLTGYTTFAATEWAIKNGLSTGGYTTIDGGNIDTTNLTFSGGIYGARFGINSRFFITTEGTVSLPTDSRVVLGDTGQPQSYMMRSSVGGDWKFYTNSTITFSGATQINIPNLCASNQPVNIPLTASSGTEKITEMKFVNANYLQIVVNRTSSNVFGIYPTVSDRKYKENILDADLSAMDFIKSIKVRKFDWIDGGAHEDFGWIAQELEQDVGENFVFQVEQSDGEFNYQVKYHVFTPLITKAIQELNQIVENQQSEMEIMKQQIADLMAKTEVMNG